MGVSPSLTIEEEDTPMKRNYGTLGKLKICHTVYAIETRNAHDTPVGGTPLEVYTSKAKAEEEAARITSYYRRHEYTQDWTCVVKPVLINTTERA